MREQYLWDRTGTPDADVVHFERLAGQFGFDAGAPAYGTTGGSKSRSKVARARATTVAAAVAAAIAGTFLMGRRSGHEHPQRPTTVAVVATAEHPTAPVQAPTTPSPAPTTAAKPTPAPPPAPHAELPPRAARPPDSRVRAQAPSTTRPRDLNPQPQAPNRAMLQSQVTAYARQTQACFVRHAPGAAGAMVVMGFLLQTDGSIVDPQLVRHSLPDVGSATNVAGCLATILKRWRLPPSAEHIRLEVPFIYSGRVPAGALP